jgi:Flp pilus assembly pilin Flp
MASRRTVVRIERGAALVEFGLLAPVLVAVLFGVVEFGLIIYAKGVLANASREGARYGVVFSTPRRTQVEIADKVREYLVQSGFPGASGVPVEFPDWPGDLSGAPLTVQVKYSYSFQVLPAFVQNLVGSVNLTAETVMLLE